MTEILRMDDGHRHRAQFDRADARPANGPEPGHKTTDGTMITHPALGSGVLQADILRTIAAIEVPAKEEVAKSIAFVSDRIISHAGAGLAAQANVVPPRALALLTDSR